MKTTKLILAGMVLQLLFTVSVYSQTNAKVIAVTNKAKWCSICEKNGDRATMVFKENNTDGAIQFVDNDLTNSETKKNSAKELSKYGFVQVMDNYNATGVTFFFDAKTKKLINKISLSKSNAVLSQAMITAKNND